MSTTDHTPTATTAEDAALGPERHIRSELAELRDHLSLPDSATAADVVARAKLVAEWPSTFDLISAGSRYELVKRAVPEWDGPVPPLCDTPCVGCGTEGDAVCPHGTVVSSWCPSCPEPTPAVQSVSPDDAHTETVTECVQPDVDKLDELGREVRKLAVLARPAAGRDLTAQDVQRAYDGTMRWEPIADYLNGIARPAVATPSDSESQARRPHDAPRNGNESLRRLARRWRERISHALVDECAEELEAELDRLRTPSPAVARTDGQPDPDPHGRYDVPDAYDHPGWPLVSRIVAIATDTDPTMPDETDGVDNAVTGLLADQSWRDHVAMADVMGLVGDWGTDDVVQAVTDALHEYPRLRARVARTDGQPPADEPHEGLTCAEHDVIDRAQAKVIREIGDLVDPDGKFLTADLPGAVREALARSAAPADDTAAAPAPWMVESRDERVDRLTRHVENVADCAGIEIEVREAGPLTGPAPLRRLVRALEGAGMLHDDPADDTAAPEDRITAVRELLNAICDPMDQAEAESHLDILGVTRAEVDEAKRRTAGQPVRGSQPEATDGAASPAPTDGGQ